MLDGPTGVWTCARLETSDQVRVGGSRHARSHVPRQLDWAVTDAKQAAHLEPDRLPQTAHLAVAALPQDHPEGGVTVLPTAIGAARRLALIGRDDPLEAGRAVIEGDTLQEPPDDLRARAPAYFHQILALELAGGVHQAVSQGAVGSKEQE